MATSQAEIDAINAAIAKTVAENGERARKLSQDNARREFGTCNESDLRATLEKAASHLSSGFGRLAHCEINRAMRMAGFLGHPLKAELMGLDRSAWILASGWDRCTRQHCERNEIRAEVVRLLDLLQDVAA